MQGPWGAAMRGIFPFLPAISFLLCSCAAAPPAPIPAGNVGLLNLVSTSYRVDHKGIFRGVDEWTKEWRVPFDASRELENAVAGSLEKTTNQPVVHVARPLALAAIDGSEWTRGVVDEEYRPAIDEIRKQYAVSSLFVVINVKASPLPRVYPESNGGFGMYIKRVLSRNDAWVMLATETVRVDLATYSVTAVVTDRTQGQGMFWGYHLLEFTMPENFDGDTPPFYSEVEPVLRQLVNSQAAAVGTALTGLQASIPQVR